MPRDFCPVSQASINYIICGKSGSVMHTGAVEDERGGRVKMAPPIITCPRREWGVSDWFISEYIIRFRFYVDGRLPSVRPSAWCDGQMTMMAKCRSAQRNTRAWIGHTERSWSMRFWSYWWTCASAVSRIWSPRYLFDSRSSIFFTRRRGRRRRRRRRRYVSSPSALRDLVRS